jgi:hypothetical protein
LYRIELYKYKLEEEWMTAEGGLPTYVRGRKKTETLTLAWYNISEGKTVLSQGINH